MTKYLLAALAALSLLLAGSGWLLRRAWAENGAQTVTIQALTEARDRAAKLAARDRAVLTRRAQENAAQARETALLRQEMQEILARHQEWSEQPVPQEVQDAILR
jgi:hypothetical protein